MNAYGTVDERPVTAILTRVIANPTMDGRKGIVFDKCLPGLLESILLRQR